MLNNEKVYLRVYRVVVSNPLVLSADHRNRWFLAFCANSSPKENYNLDFKVFCCTVCLTL